MSWYSRYKPIGDGIFLSFAYIFFIWNLYKRLPDIINGAGMVTEIVISDRNKNRNRNEE